MIKNINEYRSSEFAFLKKVNKFFIHRWIITILLAVSIWCINTSDTFAEEKFPFMGEGTVEAPYLIRNVKELETLRDMVNEGENFKECYFYQTDNLDLEGKNWIPIGLYESGKYFYGTYDGAGHYIENLSIGSRTDGGVSNQGLFGQLGGNVLNLGIESGSISGDCVASIASHAAPNTMPVIISCYSKATLDGARTGGIVDNFHNGTVINCWFDGELFGKEAGGIAAYAGVLINCLDLYDGKNTYDPKNVIDICPVNSEDNMTEGVTEDTIWTAYAGSLENPEKIFFWKQNEGKIMFSVGTLKSAEIKFEGSGTKNNPFLIQNYEDLCLLRNLVNQGETFEGVYFQQTNDIEIETEHWVPIGLSNGDNYFFGIYDGRGHKIKDLVMEDYGEHSLLEKGLFGRLGGMLVNLGLENVNISGEKSAAFAAHATGDSRTAAIINCYVTGEISGKRIGGIAYEFSGGTIANCLSDVQMSFPDHTPKAERETLELSNRGGIIATSLDTKVYSCFTTANQVMPEAYRTKTSEVLDADEVYSSKFEKKLNNRTGFTKELFGNSFNVELMQWDLENASAINFTQDIGSLHLIAIINEYSSFVLLLPILIWLICKARKQKINEWGKEKNILISLVIILGILSVFANCALIAKFADVCTTGRVLFVILLNTLFVSTLVIFLRNTTIQRVDLKSYLPLFITMIILLGFELIQFDITPRYDAGLYYGSFARGAELYRLDLFTYIGAFVCWKWAHGTALLLAPFEFLFPGQMIGVYISNVLITEITLIVLYKFFCDEFKKISPFLAAFSSFLLVLCPYQLGMFTYLCFDTHLVYYAIWLLYAYRKRNSLLVSFCGFLLCFSKISGAVFYVIFLIAATVIEVLTEYEGKIIKRIMEWWSWSRSLLWIFPAFLYLLSMVFGELFTIQHFNGANLVPSIAEKSMVSLENTIVQTFVFGFRWIFLILIIATIITCIRKPKRIFKILDKEGIRINLAAVIAGMAVIIILLLYNSDAECPRYTALMNVVYVLLTPICIKILHKKERNRKRIIIGLALLLMIQTVWTIDPSIILHKTAVDTGENKLYRLALDNDDRPGMNLGAGYSLNYGSIGDIYAYNMEYNFYNDLICDVMSEIQPDENDKFYVLDVIDYELHLNGNQYKIYWNQRLGKMTYDGKDEDSVFLQEYNISTEEMKFVEHYDDWFGDEFYLVVPARVDASDALTYLEENEYWVQESYHPSNLYGTLSVYHILN